MGYSIDNNHVDFIKNGIQTIFKQEGEIEYPWGIGKDYEAKSFQFYARKERNNPVYIGTFKLRFLDDSGILFFSDVNISHQLRNKGYGVELHWLRLQAARVIGAKSVSATSNRENDPQNKIFEKFGWTQGILNAEHYIWFKDTANLPDNSEFVPYRKFHRIG